MTQKQHQYISNNTTTIETYKSNQIDNNTDKIKLQATTVTLSATFITVTTASASTTTTAYLEFVVPVGRMWPSMT